MCAVITCSFKLQHLLLHIVKHAKLLRYVARRYVVTYAEAPSPDAMPSSGATCREDILYMEQCCVC